MKVPPIRIMDLKWLVVLACAVAPTLAAVDSARSASPAVFACGQLENLAGVIGRLACVLPVRGVPSSECEGRSSKWEGPSSECEGRSSEWEGPSSECEGPSSKWEGPSSKWEGPSSKWEGPSSKCEGPSSECAGPTSNASTLPTRVTVLPASSIAIDA